MDIWLQALSGGAPRRLTSDPDTDHLFTISPDERSVAWESHAKGTLNLVQRPAGEPKSLFTIPGSVDSYLNNGRSYAVTPDGQHFLALVAPADPTPLSATVILNWTTNLAPKR